MSMFERSQPAPPSYESKLISGGTSSKSPEGIPIGIHMGFMIWGVRLIIELDVEDSMLLLKMLEDACKEHPLVFRRPH